MLFILLLQVNQACDISKLKLQAGCLVKLPYWRYWMFS